MGSMGCFETSVATNERYVTSKKSEDNVYLAAETRNHAGLIKIAKIYILEFSELYVRTTGLRGVV